MQYKVNLTNVNTYTNDIVQAIQVTLLLSILTLMTYSIVNMTYTNDIVDTIQSCL